MIRKHNSDRVRDLGKDVIMGIIVMVLVLFFASMAPGQKIVTSKHNLSVTGPGPVKASSEDRICIFCHTPHGGRGNAPLWNRRDSSAAYIPYDSPSLQANPGQPTGASKLCLSCHDGTIAMGDLVSESQIINMSGSQTMPPGPGLIGTDLRDDHPISFPYIESFGLKEGELAPPGTWDSRIELDSAGDVQCTTCHDPHNDQWGDFLVMDNQFAMMCQECHTLGEYVTTPHADSSARWKGSGVNPWPHTKYTDVRSNSCMNCHVSHHAGGPQGLLTSEREEETCFVCHNGNVARANLEAVFQKAYTHPVELYQGVHEEGETPADASTHVECADCHNVHVGRNIPAIAPNVKGVTLGVSGMDSSGAPLREAYYEYQICYKCHGQLQWSPLNEIPRQITTSDVTREFSLSSPSFHPVEGPGRGMSVPSLISPLSPASVIYCTDCHGNDEAVSDLAGTAGPHGSNYEYILKYEYNTDDQVAESPTAYALCYNCHSRASILGNQSFPGHFKHIVEERASCAACHDGHGIDFGKGNTVNNAHLMNFDLSVVAPDSVTRRLEYTSFGSGAGECYLRCHNVDHSPHTY
jgi:predicted CXXCH cytochrome family protein